MKFFIRAYKWLFSSKLEMLIRDYRKDRSVGTLLIDQLLKCGHTSQQNGWINLLGRASRRSLQSSYLLSDNNRNFSSGMICFVLMGIPFC